MIVAARLADGLALYRIEPRTHRVLRLSKADARDSDPTWAPDGSRFAFVRETIHGAELRLMDADGRDLGLLRKVKDSFASPAWSPAGDQIAYDDAFKGMVALNLRSHVVHKLGATGKDASWSPDAEHIAVVHDRTANGDTSIWEVEVDGGKRRQLTHPQGGAADHAPSWSPDGKAIAFERDYDVWLLDLASGNETLLERNASNPSWSPDARMVLVAQPLRGRPSFALYAVSPTSGAKRFIAPGLWNVSSWQPLPETG